MTKVFKNIFKGILQIRLRAIRRRGLDGAVVVENVGEPAFMAHITLQTEEDGKELMATYLDEDKKKEIQRFYKGEPFVNIFCSTTFRKEYKKAKLHYKKM